MTRVRLEPIVIFGAGKHAAVVVDAVRRAGRHEILGLLALSSSDGSEQNSAYGLPILGDGRDESHLRELASDGVGGVIAIGSIALRMKILANVERMVPDFHFGEVIHPGAIVADDVQMGPGCMVLAGAVINPGTVIGRHAIVNTSTSVDHDNRLGDFVTLAPGVTTGGVVVVGARTTVGLGASIIDRITIGEGSFVGAGSTVVRDVPGGVVAYGNPARVIRPHIID